MFCFILLQHLGVAKYSVVGHVEGYISETVQYNASGMTKTTILVESNGTTLDPLG